MKKLLFIIAVFAALVFSCTGFFEMQEYNVEGYGERDQNGDIISTTFIKFDNSGKIFPVDVFSSHTRDFLVNKSIIQPNQETDKIPWVPTKTGEAYMFYLTYYMLVEGLRIPFIPQGWGTTEISIPFNATTTVPIHDVRNTITNPDALLTNDVYIIILNNFSTAVSLERGSGTSIIIPPESIDNNTNVTINTINPNSKGLFKVNPAVTTAGYFVRLTEIRENLPSDIYSLEAGNVYIINFTNAGKPVLKDSYRLTMGNFNK